MHLTRPHHGADRRIIADSWFGCVKYESELFKRGLYSTMLVKAAHKDYLAMVPGEINLEQEQQVAHSTKKDGQGSTTTIKSTYLITYMYKTSGVCNIHGQIPKSIY